METASAGLGRRRVVRQVDFVAGDAVQVPDEIVSNIFGRATFYGEVKHLTNLLLVSKGWYGRVKRTLWSLDVSGCESEDLGRGGPRDGRCVHTGKKLAAHEVCRFFLFARGFGGLRSLNLTIGDLQDTQQLLHVTICKDLRTLNLEVDQLSEARLYQLSSALAGCPNLKTFRLTVANFRGGAAVPRRDAGCPRAGCTNVSLRFRECVDAREPLPVIGLFPSASDIRVSCLQDGCGFEVCGGIEKLAVRGPLRLGPAQVGELTSQHPQQRIVFAGQTRIGRVRVLGALTVVFEDGAGVETETLIIPFSRDGEFYGTTPSAVRAKEANINRRVGKRGETAWAVAAGASVVRFTHEGYSFSQGVRWDSRDFWADKPLVPAERCVPRTVEAVEFHVQTELPNEARHFVVATASQTSTKVVRHWAGEATEHQTLRHLRETLGDRVVVEGCSFCHRPYTKSSTCFFEERKYCYNQWPRYEFDKDE